MGDATDFDAAIGSAKALCSHKLQTKESTSKIRDEARADELLA